MKNKNPYQKRWHHNTLDSLVIWHLANPNLPSSLPIFNTCLKWSASCTLQASAPGRRWNSRQLQRHQLCWWRYRSWSVHLVRDCHDLTSGLVLMGSDRSLNPLYRPTADCTVASKQRIQVSKLLHIMQSPHADPSNIENAYSKLHANGYVSSTVG